MSSFVILRNNLQIINLCLRTFPKFPPYFLYLPSVPSVRRGTLALTSLRYSTEPLKTKILQFIKCVEKYNKISYRYLTSINHPGCHQLQEAWDNFMSPKGTYHELNNIAQNFIQEYHKIVKDPLSLNYFDLIYPKHLSVYDILDLRSYDPAYENWDLTNNTIMKCNSDFIPNRYSYTVTDEEMEKFKQDTKALKKIIERAFEVGHIDVLILENCNRKYEDIDVDIPFIANTITTLSLNCEQNPQIQNIIMLSHIVHLLFGHEIEMDLIYDVIKNKKELYNLSIKNDHDAFWEEYNKNLLDAFKERYEKGYDSIQHLRVNIMCLSKECLDFLSHSCCILSLKLKINEKNIVGLCNLISKNNLRTLNIEINKELIEVLSESLISNTSIDRLEINVQCRLKMEDFPNLSNYMNTSTILREYKIMFTHRFNLNVNSEIRWDEADKNMRNNNRRHGTLVEMVERNMVEELEGYLG